MADITDYPRTVTLSRADYLALLEIFHYLRDDEQKDFRNSDGERKMDHIFHSIVRLRNILQDAGAELDDLSSEDDLNE